MNNDPKPAGQKRPPLVPRRYLLTFILITSLFANWGYDNDNHNPMVTAFPRDNPLSAAMDSMLQFT